VIDPVDFGQVARLRTTLVASGATILDSPSDARYVLAADGSDMSAIDPSRWSTGRL